MAETLKEYNQRRKYGTEQTLIGQINRTVKKIHKQQNRTVREDMAKKNRTKSKSINSKLTTAEVKKERNNTQGREGKKNK